VFQPVLRRLKMLRAFKNIRVEEVSPNHFVIRATVNLSETFAGCKGNEDNLSTLSCIVVLFAGLKLVNQILVDYPHYAILTTDRAEAEIIGKGELTSTIKTKYLAGRWCEEFQPFEMVFAVGRNYPISYPVEAAVGSTISWEMESPTWPTGQHVMHLILSKKGFDSSLVNRLSEADGAVSLERAVIAQDAVMIFPEFGEPLMPPEWRSDPIFSDHQYEPSYKGGIPMVTDIYVITKDENMTKVLGEMMMP
jgi:hypothetical protein